jgi:hypothetical protein
MTAQPVRATCPNCGTKGQLVGNATIKCLLNASLHRVKAVQHRFCAARDCAVVYFAEDGSEIFYTCDVRERVYQKETDAGDVLVCYCFFHTLDDIRVDAETHDRSIIVDNIKVGVEQGYCACDWRNPQGTCCLGNVLQIVKAIK